MPARRFRGHGLICVVKAETRAEAEQKLRVALAASDAHLGMLDDAPIVAPVEIEGDLDLIEAVESTGEEWPLQARSANRLCESSTSTRESRHCRAPAVPMK
jgi:hypothetical protein